MRLVLLSGSAHPALADALGAALGVAPAARTCGRFPDGEPRVAVHDPVGGADVYLLQPLAAPADVHLVELLLLADACRRAGAARITAVVPYLAFARQDRRRADGEPLAARLAAELISARADRVIAVDVHGSGAEGAFSAPLVHLGALEALEGALRGHAEGAVVVSPDLGAARRAELLAARLGAPAAVVLKTRVSAEEVRMERVAGEVAGRAVILVDDMISTGGTIEAAVRTLLAAGCRPGVTVAATHPVLCGDAPARLARLGLARLVVTDTLPVAPAPGLAVQVVAVAPLLAEAIRRLREGAPLTGLLA